MIYYRVAIRGSQSAMWCWKSGPLTSLHLVLGWLHQYRCVPKEHIRVFQSTSPEQREEMLSQANQGLLCTAVIVEQLWEVRRLEVELGAGSDHDQPYTWSLPPSGAHVLSWTKLRTLREGGDFVP